MADPKEEEWRDDLAQRVLLRQGDQFFLPPGNIYRLENHSAVKSCMLFWTIIKPLENANYDSYGTTTTGAATITSNTTAVLASTH